jgi:hypothetical protein
VVVEGKDSDLRVNHMSFWCFLTPDALHLTTYVNILTLCAMRSALCCIKMAQDRLEECLQAVVTGTYSGTIER